MTTAIGARVLENPYANRSAIRVEESFFGRSEEIRDLYTRLMGRMSVALVGERRVGKSSLMNALQFPRVRSEHGLPEDIRFAAVDSQYIGTVTEEQFLAHLCGRIGRATGVPAPTPGREGLEKVLRALQRDDKRLVVMIDEFDELVANPHIRPELFNYLRACAGEFPVMFVVVFKESDLDQLVNPDDVGSAFLNIFGSVYVGPMKEAEARDLICEPAARAGVTLDEGDVEWVQSMAGRLPYFIQVACYHLFNASGLQKLTDDGRQRLQDAFTFEALPHLRYLWSCLLPREKRLLRSWEKEGNRKQPEPKESRALKQLLQKGILIETPKGLCIFSRVFQQLIEETEDEEANSNLESMFRAVKERLSGR